MKYEWKKLDNVKEYGDTTSIATAALPNKYNATLQTRWHGHGKYWCDVEFLATGTHFHVAASSGPYFSIESAQQHCEDNFAELLRRFEDAL